MKKFNSDFKDIAVSFLTRLKAERDEEGQLQMVIDCFSHLLVKEEVIFNKKLTPREITCLFLAARGKTSKETAEFLGIKISTVNTYRQDILRKLSCHNLAHAVFEGIRFGYLSPNDKS